MTTLLVKKRIRDFCSVLLGSLFVLILFLLFLQEAASTVTVGILPDEPKPAVHRAVEQIIEERNQSALATTTGLTETSWVSGGPYGSSIQELFVV